MNILFITTFTDISGSGHFHRCEILAKKLLKRGNSVSFYEPFIGSGQKKIVRKDFDFDCILTDRNFDYIFCDSYLLETDDYKRWRKKCNTLVVLDELCNRFIECDFLYDPILYRSPQDYINKVGDGTHLLLGGEYAIVENIDRRYLNLFGEQEKDRMHIYMGQSDFELSNLIYSKIKEVSIQKDVVLGRSLTEDEKRLNKLANGDKFFPFTKPFYKTFNRTKVCVGAPGTSLWYRLIFQIPTVLTITNDNQIDICRNLEKEGYLVLAPIDWKNETSALINTIVDLISEPSRIKKIQQKLKNCINLDGADKLLNHVGL